MSCKVLRYCWNPLDNLLNVNNDKPLKNKDMKEYKFMKKGVLRIIERIYDPLSLISPFSVWAKILLQDIWKKKLD